MYPESLKARVGESVQFVCAVSGVGQNYSIKWYNDYNPENVINHSHVLDIHHVELNDSGDYYCEVSNEHGGHNSTLAVLKVVGESSVTAGCYVLTVLHVIKTLLYVIKVVAK